MQRAIVLASLLVVGDCLFGVAARSSGPSAERPRHPEGPPRTCTSLGETPTTQHVDRLATHRVLHREGVVLSYDLAGAGRDLERSQSVTDTPSRRSSPRIPYRTFGSNTEFPATVEYVAHENTRANMRSHLPPSQTATRSRATTPRYLPKRTYKDRLTLFFGQDSHRPVSTSGAGHTKRRHFSCSRCAHTCTRATCIRRAHASSTRRQRRQRRSNSVRRCSARSSINTSTPSSAAIPLAGTWADFVTYVDLYRHFLTRRRKR